MTQEQTALACRAVACKGWRWMRGMNTTTGDTFIAFSDCDEAYWLAHPDDPCEVEPIAGLLPDLTDPATLGCLLALVREAWGDHATSFANGYAEPQNVWVVHNGRFSSDDYGPEIAKGSTEADALVRALEAAP